MTAQDKHFAISRVFDAPRELVWKAHTEAAHLKHWWGPKGSTVKHCRIDLRPGGMIHYCLQPPDGSEMWGKCVLCEIVPLERLVGVVSFSDKDGGITSHPMSPTWPREILSVITFTEEGGKTRVTVDWIPQNASEIERKTFNEGRDSMRQGWGGTLDKLEAYLAEV